MTIKRINEFPVASGVNLTPDDIFLVMDDPSGSATTKKVSLATLSSVLGAGGTGNADTGDITFSGSTISTANSDQDIILDPNGSGNVVIGTNKNLVLDINAWTAQGIKIIDSTEDGYDNPETPSVLKVGSIYHDTGTMVIKSDGAIYPSEDPSAEVNTYGGLVLTNKDYSAGLYIAPPVDVPFSTVPSGSISVNGSLRFDNNTTLAKGTFNNNTGGSGGISLTCAVGYQLNWQGGHLKNVQIGDVIGDPRTIYCDSPIQFTSPSAITFSNSTSLTDAIVTWKGLYQNGIYEQNDVVYTIEFGGNGSSGLVGKLWVVTDASGSQGDSPSLSSAPWTLIGGGTSSTIVTNIVFDTTLNTDASSGDIFNVTLTDNTTLANPTNPVDGKTLRWRITQDGTGSRTVILGNKFNLPSSASSPLPWSTSPNKMDVLAATYHSGRDKWDIVAFVPGY